MLRRSFPAELGHRWSKPTSRPILDARCKRTTHQLCLLGMLDRCSSSGLLPWFVHGTMAAETTGRRWRLRTDRSVFYLVIDIVRTLSDKSRTSSQRPPPHSGVPTSSARINWRRPLLFSARPCYPRAPTGVPPLRPLAPTDTNGSPCQRGHGGSHPWPDLLQSPEPDQCWKSALALCLLSGKAAPAARNRAEEVEDDGGEAR